MLLVFSNKSLMFGLRVVVLEDCQIREDCQRGVCMPMAIFSRADVAQVLRDAADIPSLRLARRASVQRHRIYAMCVFSTIPASGCC